MPVWRRIVLWFEPWVCSPRSFVRLPPLALCGYYVCSHVCTTQGIVVARQNQLTPGPKAKGPKAGGSEGYPRSSKKKDGGQTVGGGLLQNNTREKKTIRAEGLHTCT